MVPIKGTIKIATRFVFKKWSSLLQGTIEESSAECTTVCTTRSFLKTGYFGVS